MWMSWTARMARPANQIDDRLARFALAVAEGTRPSVACRRAGYVGWSAYRLLRRPTVAALIDALRSFRPTTLAHSRESLKGASDSGSQCTELPNPETQASVDGRCEVSPISET